MKTSISEAEILLLFQQLSIETDEERKRALFMLDNACATKPPMTVRFDIGFNASLPHQ
jgi:hypothetical protein